VSPLVITLLVVAGIFILIAIGYINHMVENNKLEKARLCADLNDRLRRCETVSQALPGQLMTSPLKLLLSRLLLQFSERLLALDKTSRGLQTRIEELRALVASGESIAVPNPPQPIQTEEKAKEIRFLLENLHGVLNRGAQDGLLSATEATHWGQEIQHMLALLHIELFSNLGQQALQKIQPGQARLAFERGVQYLNKQSVPTRYQAQLKQFEQQLARATAVVLENSQLSDEPSELTDGLQSLSVGEEWKKKNNYD
jgi:hypothetical protein